MKNKTKIKLLLSLILLATPSVAQDIDVESQKRAMRAKNFAEFLLYWSEWGALVDVSNMDKRRAERDTCEGANAQIPDLVRDSTYYANEIVKAAPIINKRFPLGQSTDMAYFLYEIKDIYKDKKADKSSPEYTLGKNLNEYEKVLKKLKLARYTIDFNKKQK